ITPLGLILPFQLLPLSSGHAGGELSQPAPPAFILELSRITLTWAAIALCKIVLVEVSRMSVSAPPVLVGAVGPQLAHGAMYAALIAKFQTCADALALAESWRRPTMPARYVL